MDELRADLLGFIQNPGPDAFDALAHRVVAHQVDTIPSYRRLCSARQWDGSWQTAPLVPTELFRELDLCGAEPGLAEATFLTSGTTGAGRRGQRRVPDLTLYHAAMKEPFVTHVLRGDRSRRPWLCLLPSIEVQPESSLGHMVHKLADLLSVPDRTRWCVSADGVDVSSAWSHLEEQTSRDEPLVVLTTSFALIQFLDAIPDRHVRLPQGSVMMLTGGFKGRSRTVDEPTLLGEITLRLGLSPEDVVPEYGMTELTSQAYGRPLVAPPWLKIRVMNPDGQRDAATGQRGLVGFFDLLNLDNVSSILTGDLGILDDAGALTLLGRIPGAPLRGCSLTAEELGVKRP